MGDSAHEQGTVTTPPLLFMATTAWDTMVKTDNVIRSTVQVSMCAQKANTFSNTLKTLVDPYLIRKRVFETTHAKRHLLNTICFLRLREFKIRFILPNYFSLQLMGSGPAGKSGQVAQHLVRMESDHVSGHVTILYQGTADRTAMVTLTRYKRATSKNVQVMLFFANSINAMNSIIVPDIRRAQNIRLSAQFSSFTYSFRKKLRIIILDQPLQILSVLNFSVNRS